MAGSVTAYFGHFYPLRRPPSGTGKRLTQAVLLDDRILMPRPQSVVRTKSVLSIL